MLLNAILVLGRRSHCVQLLPLIDIDQQPIRFLWRSVEAVIDHAGKFVRVTVAIEPSFLFQVSVDLGRTGVLGHTSEGGRKRAQWPRAWSERDNFPSSRLALLAQRRQQAREDQRRLAAARRPDDSDKAVYFHLLSKFADCGVPAAEKRRILFPERFKPPIRADPSPQL